MDRKQHDGILAVLKVEQAHFRDLDAVRRELYSFFGELLRMRHSLLSAVKLFLGKDDPERFVASLEPAELEKLVARLPAEHARLLSDRINLMHDTVITARFVYVRAQQKTLNYELGLAKRQASLSADTQPGSYLGRLLSLGRRLEEELEEARLRQVKVEERQKGREALKGTLAALQKTILAPPASPPPTLAEMFTHLRREGFAWNLIPRMQASLEALTGTGGEILRRQYELISSLCEVRRVDRRGFMLRPVAELLRNRLASAAVERVSKELEQASAATPAAVAAPKE